MTFNYNQFQTAQLHREVEAIMIDELKYMANERNEYIAHAAGMALHDNAIFNEIIQNIFVDIELAYRIGKFRTNMLQQAINHHLQNAVPYILDFDKRFPQSQREADDIRADADKYYNAMRGYYQDLDIELRSGNRGYYNDSRQPTRGSMYSRNANATSSPFERHRGTADTGRVGMAYSRNTVRNPVNEALHGGGVGDLGNTTMMSRQSRQPVQTERSNAFGGGRPDYFGESNSSNDLDMLEQIYGVRYDRNQFPEFNNQSQQTQQVQSQQAPVAQEKLVIPEYNVSNQSTQAQPVRQATTTRQIREVEQPVPVDNSGTVFVEDFDDDIFDTMEVPDEVKVSIQETKSPDEYIDFKVFTKAEVADLNLKHVATVPSLDQYFWINLDGEVNENLIPKFLYPIESTHVVFDDNANPDFGRAYYLSNGTIYVLPVYRPNDDSPYPFICPKWDAKIVYSLNENNNPIQTAVNITNERELMEYAKHIIPTEQRSVIQQSTIASRDKIVQDTVAAIEEIEKDEFDESIEGYTSNSNHAMDILINTSDIATHSAAQGKRDNLENNRTIQLYKQFLTNSASVKDKEVLEVVKELTNCKSLDEVREKVLDVLKSKGEMALYRKVNKLIDDMVNRLLLKLHVKDITISDSCNDLVDLYKEGYMNKIQYQLLEQSIEKALPGIVDIINGEEDDGHYIDMVHSVTTVYVDGSDIDLGIDGTDTGKWFELPNVYRGISKGINKVMASVNARPDKYGKVLYLVTSDESIFEILYVQADKLDNLPERILLKRN